MGQRQPVLLNLLEGGAAPFRVVSAMDFQCLPDISRGAMPTKQQIQSLIEMPVETYRMARINENCAAHAPCVARPRASISSRVNAENGNVAVFVGPGPSAFKIAERLKPYRELLGNRLKVVALNKAGVFVPDADYYCCIEALAPANWWSAIDPAKTMLITAPMSNGALAAKWKDGNVIYGWLRDMRQADDPRWQFLPPLMGSGTTAAPALHAISMLGFSKILLVGFDQCAAQPRFHVERNALTATYYGDGTDMRGCYAHTQGPWHLSKGINGEDVLVSRLVAQFKAMLECLIDILRDAGHDVINCNGQGLLDVPGFNSTLERELDLLMDEHKARNGENANLPAAEAVRA